MRGNVRTICQLKCFSFSFANKSATRVKKLNLKCSVWSCLVYHLWRDGRLLKVCIISLLKIASNNNWIFLQFLNWCWPACSSFLSKHSREPIEFVAFFFHHVTAKRKKLWLFNRLELISLRSRFLTIFFWHLNRLSPIIMYTWWIVALLPDPQPLIKVMIARSLHYDFHDKLRHSPDAYRPT